ncbi:MAG TPA: VOC family protein [Devosia sp.]|nr:VOC family protein [Devosia sp.]
MLDQIKGLHHVTAMAKDAAQNNGFWTRTLGLRRVKQTVNFDEPSVYHLYYGDAAGTPGSVMTYFPFPHMARGRPGTGEVGTTVFSVPEGALGWWEERLQSAGLADLARDESFGQRRLHFSGPDGDGLALVEDKNDVRLPWTQGGVAADRAIRGFHSASLRLRDEGATEELLKFMGYEIADTHDGTKRLARPGGNGADFVDLETLPGAAHAQLGAGSVHHIAFAVPTRADQLEVRKALSDTGYQLTPVIDRDYFFSVYFRTPGGVLFEIATNEPGFDRDEDTAHLGEALKLPRQHEHLRASLERTLTPLGD